VAAEVTKSARETNLVASAIARHEDGDEDEDDDGDGEAERSQRSAAKLARAFGDKCVILLGSTPPLPSVLSS